MDEYLSFAKQTAFKAGEIMLRHFTVGVHAELKSDNTPLTIADTTINAMVISEVETTYPEHSILGEEASVAKSSDYTWVCDPIDGTIPYSMGIPTNCFSLALVKNGEPIVAVLYDPYMKRMYSAVKGQGAWLNESPIHVNSKPFDANYIATSGARYGLAKKGDHLKIGFESNLWMMNFFSLTYESMLVATGQISAVTFTGTGAWDVAAVKLIVEESGGKVTDLNGNEQAYDKPINGAVISNGISHQDAINFIEKAL